MLAKGGGSGLFFPIVAAIGHTRIRIAERATAITIVQDELQPLVH